MGAAPRRESMKRSMAVAGVAVLAGLLAVPGQAAGRADPPKAQQDVAPGASAGYVGPAVCVSCHETEGKGYDDTPHGRAWLPRSPAAARGCETCHGPGQGHVDNVGDKKRIRDFRTMAPREVSATCMTCHDRAEHAQWQGSPHDARNLTCVTCHSVHGPRSEKAQLKEVTVVATCAQCHRSQAAKMMRSGHMPLREDKLDCTSCHNPHGSTGAKLLRVGNTANELCVSCHADKRGPFLWEHPPVRENCTTCHDPHGSTNERMLVTKAPMLCQRCHVGTGHPVTIWDAAAVAQKDRRIISRSCVNCHSQIHGSNHPAGREFQR